MARDGKQDGAIHLKNYNIAWAKLIIEQVQAQHYIVSPGMRNGPLINGLIHSQQSYSINIDERSAAYQALGYAKATGKRVALICTSGTAAANYYPAVIEAYYQQLPLVIIAADRPYEHSDLDVNQTMRQKDLFGSYTGPSLMLPLPNSETAIAPQMAQLLKNQKGPVHINAPFEEPLHNTEDTFEQYPLIPVEETPLLQWKEATNWGDLRATLLVIGALPNALPKNYLHQLLERFPGDIYLDISSTLKFCTKAKTIKKLSGNYSQVIHLGGRVTDKSYFDFLTGIKRIIVCNQQQHKKDHFPKHHIKILNSPELCAAQLHPLCPPLEADQQIEQQENSLAQTIINQLPQGSVLYLANSSIIRAFDRLTSCDRAIEVACNRGVSGIEGLIASSIGFATGSNKTTTLVIGDISFLHDCNSLALIKDLKLQLIVINNGGGKIFENLPVNSDSALMKVITTPHQLTFKELAKQFRLSYTLVEDQDSLSTAMNKQQNGIIEVAWKNGPM